jgi:hypothetical protein
MASNAVLTGTYDPSQLVVTIGSVIVTGFDEGDAIDVKRYEDNYFIKGGLDGGVARARNANKTGSIEITLLATSGANDQLSNLFYADSLDNDGTPVTDVLLADLSGRTVCWAAQGWLKKLPDIKFGKEVGQRKWVVDCAALKISAGGNNV